MRQRPLAKVGCVVIIEIFLVRVRVFFLLVLRYVVLRLRGRIVFICAGRNLNALLAGLRH